MEEKLRFRVISRVKISPEEEYQREVQNASNLIKDEKIEQNYIELPIYDIICEQISLQTKFHSLNTEVKEVLIEKVTLPLFDISLTKQEMKLVQIPATDLIEPRRPEEVLKVSDVELFVAKITQVPVSLSTDITKNMHTDITEGQESYFDLKLESKALLRQEEPKTTLSSDLDTELETTNIENGIETLEFSKQQATRTFEDFINCDEDKKFPRSFSESLNSPFVVLISEGEKEWHIPIIYALKELFREITDKYPRVTFREPELFEEGEEENVDSLDPHSLDQFTFENKIEFLDARRMRLAVEEFVKIVKGRLKSGFLQQFGILVIAIKQDKRDKQNKQKNKEEKEEKQEKQEDLNENLEKVKKALEEFKGLRIYTCSPDNEKYEKFCSKILGVSPSNEFFDSLRRYERHLTNTCRKFSVFVDRGAGATDKFQYPLKVATFVYLVNNLRSRRKKLINNLEELYKFIGEILGKEIKVESPIKVLADTEKEVTVIVPDIIYSPEGGEEIYVEIETLIGTIEPLKKIDETIEKYKEIIKDAKIWIVLKPVSAVLHYDELKAKKRAYEAIYGDKKIEFKVLTLSENKSKWNLVSIEEFVGGKDAK